VTSFYIDSADRTLAEPLLSSGVFAGLTTNPEMLRSAGVANEEIDALVGWATAAGADTVFVQAWGADAAALEASGRAIRQFGANTVVKVPATQVGLQVTARLVSSGIPVLVTAVYAAKQVLPAMAAGAQFIAPYLGRMNDAGRDGLAEIAAMQRMIEADGSELKILVASLRTPVDATRLAEIGVSHFTLAPEVWDQFFDDELTAAAVKVFDEASAAGDRQPSSSR
jgi:TalC/MipB family fructose-6-phosphate aldolase